MNNTITYKTCSKCGVEKLKKDYHVNKCYKDKLNAKCKECVKENNIQYRLNNPNSICHTCGKHHYITNNQKKNTNHNFCSKECYIEHQRLRVETDLLEGKKTCYKCKSRKQLTDFNFDKKSLDGYYSACRECSFEIRKESKLKKQQNFIPTITEKKCNKCKITKSVSLFKIQITTKDGYAPKCNDCHNLENKLLRNKRIINNNYKNITEKKCCGCNKIMNIENFYTNKHTIDGYRYNCIICEGLLRKKNQKSISKRKRERYNNEPIVRLKKILRGRIKKYIDRKSVPMNSIIGCDWETLKNHIESQFTEGMTWDNQGQYGWHIDHIIPLNSAKTEQEIYELNHYRNLQPLWAKDNLRKSDKISKEWGNA